ncbi:ATP-binding protein [Niallia taxi]|nr:ATP-binding protein [Niallia taxi]MDE5052484.1 ATP-binding protein [Niallia taxi]
MLLGPPGLGKTHLTVGLGLIAIQKGFPVYFVTMGELLHLLKTKNTRIYTQLTSATQATSSFRFSYY